MDDFELIEKAKRDLRFGTSHTCAETDDCTKCEYRKTEGVCFNAINAMENALYVIGQLQAENETLKAMNKELEKQLGMDC